MKITRNKTFAWSSGILIQNGWPACLTSNKLFLSYLGLSVYFYANTIKCNSILLLQYFGRFIIVFIFKIVVLFHITERKDRERAGFIPTGDFF